MHTKISPTVPASSIDNGKVQLGGTSRSVETARPTASTDLPVRRAPSSIADNGKVCLGATSPRFDVRPATR